MKRSSMKAPDAATVRACLRRDRERLLRWRERQGLDAGWLVFDPSYQAVWLHRWSAFMFSRGRRLTARFLWHLNVFLTGADISPLSRFGAGLLICYPSTVVLFCTAGEELTVGAQAVTGGGLSGRDIGAGPGLPVLGDDVDLGVGAMVLGPVRIGSRARIGARCTVVDDLPNAACVPPAAVAFQPMHIGSKGT
jgi:serine O-acetyltransferase